MENREGSTVRERVYKALMARYIADQDEALVKIDALMKGEVVPGHYDITADIDKLLAKVAFAAEKMATLRRFYGTNQAFHFTYSTKTHEKSFKIKKRTNSVKVSKQGFM